MPTRNAVLDDKELQKQLIAINPKYGEWVIRAAGEVWGLPIIDQKTKALFTIVADIINQSLETDGPFAAHLHMALQEGASRAEIEEVLLFMSVYAGFNKVANSFIALNKVLGPPTQDQASLETD